MRGKAETMRGKAETGERQRGMDTVTLGTTFTLTLLLSELLIF